MIEVMCWCGSKVVEVTEADYARFETKSCMRPSCDPDKDHYNWRMLHRKQSRRVRLGTGVGTGAR